MTKKPKIIVHGGAWDIPGEVHKAHLKGCRKAAELGYEILSSGGSALDAVEAAVRALEGDPTFDAGRGSFLNLEAEVEMDAIIMDGRDLESGAVAGVGNVRNPVSLARLVMEKTDHLLLIGEGAKAFAPRCGVRLCPTEELLVGRELRRYRALKRKKDFKPRTIFEPKRSGTVGAVAIDKEGNLASATSTGGVPKKLPGRVADTPIIGCGAYADNSSGAVSSTGWGESIMKVLLAKTVCDFMAEGFTALVACRKGIQLLGRKVGGLGGAIAIDRRGNLGFSYNTPHMAYAFADGRGKTVSRI
ncbi:MAG: isoaspartyl peptidase/L-asparaginase [Candidatus Zixiibacteriota bacterium]